MNPLCACYVLSLVGLVLAASAPARAVTYPINFTGTEQDFVTTIDLSGNLNAVGSGVAFSTKSGAYEPFLLTAPFDHPLSLFGPPLHLSTNPKTDPHGTTFDATPGSLIDMNGLDLDFLNGQTLDFALDTIKITTNSSDFLVNVLLNYLDLSGTLSQLRFDQTGAAAILGGGGSGTFSVLGDLGATVDNLLVSWAGLLYFPVDPQNISLPGAFTGTWKLVGPAINLKVSLDGSLSIDVPLALISNLTTSITDILTLTISTTFDMAASLNVSFSYHLEDQLYFIPEPSSVVLLGIGLCAAVVPLARRLRRK